MSHDPFQRPQLTCVVRNLASRRNESLQVRSRLTIDVGDEVGRGHTILVCRRSANATGDIDLTVQFAYLLTHGLVRAMQYSTAE